MENDGDDDCDMACMYELYKDENKGSIHTWSPLPSGQ